MVSAAARMPEASSSRLGVAFPVSLKRASLSLALDPECQQGAFLTIGFCASCLAEVLSRLGPVEIGIGDDGLTLVAAAICQGLRQHWRAPVSVSFSRGLVPPIPLTRIKRRRFTSRKRNSWFLCWRQRRWCGWLRRCAPAGPAEGALGTILARSVSFSVDGPGRDERYSGSSFR